MRYTIDLNDSTEYGITAAREAFNASLPATISTPSDVEGEPATESPNPSILATNASYVAYVLGSAAESWCRQYAPVVVPDVPKAGASGVPQSITKKQGRAQLKAEGLLTAVEGYIASLPSDDDVRMTYEDAGTWVRTDPSVLGMMALLKKTDADADAFFVAASQR